MTKLPLFAAVATAFALAAPAAAEEEATGEERLAELLEGRVAGEPQGCINVAQVFRIHVIEDTAIVYDAGGTFWVNRTQNASQISEDDFYTNRRDNSSLCANAVLDARERVDLLPTNVIILDEFVPYRRAG